MPDEVATSLTAQLKHIRSLIEAPGSRNRFMEWVTGSRVESVWQQLHSVERSLVGHRAVDELTGQLPSMVTGAQRFLPKGTRTVDMAVRWMKQAPRKPTELRAGIRTLLEESNQASDSYYAKVRTLRNRLLALSLSAFLIAVALVVVQWRTETLPMIAVPEEFGGRPWQLLVLVLAFGALGAFVTGLVPMLKAGGGSLPYKLPFQQGLLKIAVGPLAAVVGLTFVVGGLTGTKAEGLPQLLALAVVFGSAQQALTGFADRSAADVLATKDSPSTS